jgi:hypothetical protein
MDWNGSSTEIDKSLRLQVEEIERRLLEKARALDPNGNHHTWGAKLHAGNQTWVGLHPDSIQTPYSELLRITEVLNPVPGSTIVDFGAGYGRLGILLHKRWPGVIFQGIEFVSERVEEGKRVYRLLGIDPDSLLQGDLTHEDFFPEASDHYFIYDFGKVSHIRKLLNQLSELANTKKFTVTGRGNGIRSLISHEFPWLSTFYEEKNFSIYSF